MDIDASALGHIDLLIGGSPCTDFSFAGKRAGMSTQTKENITTLDRYLELKNEGMQFVGESFLFWEYVRILNELRKTNPSVMFFLENVEMGKYWEDMLTNIVGVKGIHIDSALVSAQHRKRIYWTNFRAKPHGLLGIKKNDIPHPQDRGINVKSVLESQVDSKFYLKQEHVDKLMSTLDIQPPPPSFR